MLLRSPSPVHTHTHTHLHAHSIQCSFACEIARQWLIRRCLCTCVREICVCERGTERKFGSELCGWVFAWERVREKAIEAHLWCIPVCLYVQVMLSMSMCMSHVLYVRVMLHVHESRCICMRDIDTSVVQTWKVSICMIVSTNPIHAKSVKRA